MALARLEQLTFVGITEDMAGSMDALSRQLDIPNLYVGQFHNITTREGPIEGDSASDIDDDCLGLIEQANMLDMIVYDRALTLALGDRQRIRTIRCIPAGMPGCHVRSRFADTWVENRAGGYILFGPYVRLLPGRYTVVFRLRQRLAAMESWGAGSLGHLDVIARKGGLVLARRELQDVFGHSAEVTQRLSFEVNHLLHDAEFRVLAEPGAPFDVEISVNLHHT
jgi:hypothetical protein